MENYVKVCSYAICAITAGFYGKHEALQSILMVLWMADTFTGILRAFRLWRLKSRSIWYGTISKTLLLWVPFTIHIAAEAVQSGSGNAITSIAFATLCMAEVISNIQNIQVIKTGVDITEQDAMSKVLNGILTLLNKMLEKTVWHLQSQK